MSLAAQGATQGVAQGATLGTTLGTTLGRFRLARHARLGSTSDHLLALAEQDAPDGEAALAYVQTAGRGSRGRSWFDAPGNLAVSMLVRAPELSLTIWPFLAGCATIEALDAHGGHGLRLKWPNDVLDGEGGKVAGILVESGTSRSGAYVVIGIGINLIAAPGIGQARAVGLRADVDAVAETLLARLDTWIQTAGHGGFAAVRAAWLGRAHDPGATLVVRRRDGASQQGGFAGLDADGALLLDVDGRVLRICTGDVLELA